MLHQNKEVNNNEEDMGCRGVTNGIQKRMEKEKSLERSYTSGLGNI